MKTRRICARCESLVKKETQIKEYPFYCLSCDENLYRFETINLRRFIRTYGRKPNKE